MTSGKRHLTREVTSIIWCEFQVNSACGSKTVAKIGCKEGHTQVTLSFWHVWRVHLALAHMEKLQGREARPFGTGIIDYIQVPKRHNTLWLHNSASKWQVNEWGFDLAKIPFIHLPNGHHLFSATIASNEAILYGASE